MSDKTRHDEDDVEAHSRYGPRRGRARVSLSRGDDEEPDVEAPRASTTPSRGREFERFEATTRSPTSRPMASHDP